MSPFKGSINRHSKLLYCAPVFNTHYLSPQLQMSYITYYSQPEDPLRQAKQYLLPLSYFHHVTLLKLLKRTSKQGIGSTHRATQFNPYFMYSLYHY